jgi:YYY domain-containing protein
VWLRSKVGYANITEQPMDMMYVNAATRASHFPPQDPWLSGHTVAYYYFGYLLVAMTGRLAEVPTDVAYNIGLAMIAAMAFVSAAGLVYNLVHLRESAVAPAGASAEKSPRSLLSWRPPLFGVAGGLFLVAMGNLTWVFVFLSSYGIGGKSFYDWIDVEGLGPDEKRFHWFPSEFFGFFGASRIYPLSQADDTARVITEFPMFSFVLGDLHPHVMALPFVLIAVALALTLYRSPEPLDLAFWLQRPLALAAAAMIVGGLAFLNTWDIATMAFVVVAAATLKDGMLVSRARDAGVSPPGAMPFTQTTWNIVIVGLIVNMMAFVLAVTLGGLAGAALMAVVVILELIVLARLYFGGWITELAVQALSFAVPLIVLGVVLYLPFYLSFTSQADGIGAVVSNPGITIPATKPLHLLIFWGPMFALALPLVGARLLAARGRITRRMMAISAAPTVLVILGWAVVFLFEKARGRANLGGGHAGLFTQIGDRSNGWITALFLGALLAAALTALWCEITARRGESGEADGEREPLIFVLGLISTALLLVLGTEFFFVGDVFRSRMNTVFKLYYQAWMMLAVASGFAVYYLTSRWRASFPRALWYRVGWGALAVVVLLGAATYPFGGWANRIHNFQGDLHADRFLSPDEQNAVAWLQGIAQGQDFVIAEGVGNDYDAAVARFATASGVPTVLGWKGHEDQWRGGSCTACAGRFEDVNTLYQTTDTSVMSDIARKYKITFVIVGDVERQKYNGPGLEKFASLPVAFQSGAVTIYRMTGLTGEVEAARR